MNMAIYRCCCVFVLVFIAADVADVAAVAAVANCRTQAVFQGWEFVNVFDIAQPSSFEFDQSRDIFLHPPPLQHRSYNLSGAEGRGSFSIFWPTNVHQPGVVPKQPQQLDDNAGPPSPQSSVLDVLKVVIKFRIEGSSNGIMRHASDRFDARSIPPNTASSASCMGMASPYDHQYEDTQGTSGSEKVLHRNVW